MARRRPPSEPEQMHWNALPRGLPGSAIVWIVPRSGKVVPAQWRARHAPRRRHTPADTEVTPAHPGERCFRVLGGGLGRGHGHGLESATRCHPERGSSTTESNGSPPGWKGVRRTGFSGALLEQCLERHVRSRPELRFLDVGAATRVSTDTPERIAHSIIAMALRLRALALNS